MRVNPSQPAGENSRGNEKKKNSSTPAVRPPPHVHGLASSSSSSLFQINIFNLQLHHHLLPSSFFLSFFLSQV
jgi:hypothetical protein